jgi:flagellar hook-basal body complex protein FliE
MQVNSVSNSISIANPIGSLPDSYSATSSSPGTPFAGLFHEAMRNMQELEDKASTAVQGLLDGSGVDVHTAMLATSSADTAFELALSVRGKAVSAFQQLMSMQF